MALSGVRIGVDVGRARIGIARSDRDLLLATPVETVPRDLAGSDSDVRRIVEIVDELAAVEIVVGLPISLSGARTASTEDAVRFAERIAAACPDADVRLVDERLSTVSAQSALHTSGRRTKGSRSVIDQIAAVIILQQALDTERASGDIAGTAVVRGADGGSNERVRT